MRKLSGFVAALPLIFSFALSYFQYTPADYGEQLQFDKNSEFHMLLLAGFLEGEKEFSQNTKDYLQEIIEQSQPNFVVLGANNIYPQPLIADLFLGYSFDVIDEYVKIFEENKVYFTVLFGGYDTKGLYDKSAQVKRYMRSEYFVGGINGNNGINTLYDRKNNIVNTFQTTILSVNNKSKNLIIIDYQKEDDTLNQQVDWINSHMELPSIIFSYDKLYDESLVTQPDSDFLLFNENIQAFISFNSSADADVFFEDNILFSEMSLSAKIKDGILLRSYKAKKIVLTEDGGLSFVRY